jgi:predicted porin
MHRHPLFPYAFVLLPAVCSTCLTSAFGQVAANMSSRISDPTGAVIPGAATAADNSESGISRNAVPELLALNNSIGDIAKPTTGANGAYRFSLLPTGGFAARFAAAAFQSPEFDLANFEITGIAGFNQVHAGEPAPAPPANPDALTWHGINLYGAFDVGFGWVSHGLPQNAYNYEGSSLVNRNANSSRFLVEPNNLSQTGLGIRGHIEFAHGWSVVFNGSTGFNPQSGQLANASLTDIRNNGLPRASYSEAIDGARAGQPFNDELYGGISSTNLGTLTFGRQRALGTDTMLLYDPVAGGYAFSYIGYNGTMAAGGDTEDTRWDNAVKYRVALGPVHFGAMGKFADGNGGCYLPSPTATSWTASNCTPVSPHNTAWGFNLGGGAHKFSSDLVYQHYNQAISIVNPLLGPTSPTQPYQSTVDSINMIEISGTNPIAADNNLISTDNTLYGIVTDNNAVMGTAKYAGDPFKVYAGYEYIWQNNPANPLGVGATDQGGYAMSGVEDNNLDSEKLVQIWWTGVKYTYLSKTDFTFSWYGQQQNDFRYPKTCSAAAGFRSSCGGTLDEGSLYTDHSFTRRFDGFAGLAYSFVTGGVAIAIPHGPGVPYLHNSNFAPTIGGRFTF